MEGGGRDREGGAQAEYLVEGGADQVRPAVRGGGPGGEMHLGGGQAQSRGFGEEPGDVEWSVGQGGDALSGREELRGRLGLRG